MDNRHQVELAVFDISFGSEGMAFEGQADLGVLVNSRLMPVVDRVFNEVSAGEEVFRINSLEVDLGDVAYQGFTEELEVRLEERLRSALREKLASGRTQTGRDRSGPDEAALTREQSEIEQLEYFLLNGRAPWHADLGSQSAVNQLFQRVIQSNALELVDFLRRSPGRLTAIRRLVSQFSDDVLAGLAGILVPSNTGFPAKLVADFRRLWRNYGSVDGTEREFRTCVWEQLITELLESRRPSFDPAILVDRIVKRITSRLGGGNPGLLEALANESASLARTDGLGPGPFPAAPEEENGRPKPADTPKGMTLPPAPDFSRPQQDATDVPAGSPDERPFDDIELLRRRLADAMSRGDVEALGNVWPILLRGHSDLLIEAFRLFSRRINFRRMIASRLPESMLRNLVDLLEPAESGFINEIVARPDLFLHALGQPGVSADNVRKQIWEYTLSYLVGEGGSRFNKRSYIRSLVQQIASHSDIEYDGLIQSLVRGMESSRTSDALPGDLPAVVSDLAADIRAGQSTHEDSGSESLGLIQSYELYDALRRRLSGVGSSGEEGAGDLTRSIDQLASAYPWQLRRLYRELQAGEFSGATIAAALSATELSDLVYALLSVTQQSAGAGSSDLMDAIERYAGQATDRKRYYQRVLECLVQNQRIDFEVIALAGQSALEGTGPGETSLEAAPSGNQVAEGIPPPAGDEATEALLRHLREGGSVSTDDDGQSTPEDSASGSLGLIQSYELYEGLRQRLLGVGSFGPEGARDLTRLVDQLASAYPWQLMRLYRELQAGELAAATIAAALSADELSHLVHAFLSVTQPSNEAGSSDLMDVIERYAEQAQDRKAYYLQVLECLVLDQNIDFEVIIEANQPAFAGAGTGETSLESAPSGSHPAEGIPAPPGQEADDELHHYLREGGSDSAQVTARLIRTLETMLFQQPGRLRQLLGPVLDVREAAERITDLLPERLLTRVLYVFRPNEHSRAQRTADIIADACQDQDPSIGSGNVIRLKWRYIFRYLLEEGLPYEERAYVRGFAGYLAAEINQGDAGEFQTQLIQQITQNIRPATRARHQAIVHALIREKESESAQGNPPKPVPSPVGSSGPDNATDGAGQQIRSRADADQATPGDSASESLGLIQSYELYEALRQRLLGVGLNGEEASGDLTGVIDQLAGAYPWQLMRLYRELRAGELAAATITAALSAAELFHLIGALLSVTQPSGEAVSSDLIDAIERYAGQAMDRKGYYRRVLECLVQDQNIDFEAIIEADQPGLEGAEPGWASLEAAASGSHLAEGILAPTGDDAAEALLRYLREGGSVTAEDTARLIRPLESMLVQRPGRLRQLLEPVLEVREAAERIADLLPERLLTRVLYLLRPNEHSSAQRTADIIADARQDLDPSIGSANVVRLKWRYIFRHLLEERLSYEEGAFVRGIAGYLAVETNQADDGEFRARLSQQITQNILPATRARHEAIMQALTGEGPAAGTRREPVSPSVGSDDAEPDINENIYIANAGQVLAAPYLSRLFTMLDLTEGSAFKDRKASEKAVHLLQYMVNQSTNSPEYQLVLNKILCGVRVGLPIERETDITDREKEVVEGMIQGMIQNWRTIGNTSISGFRESFLQRGGRLWLQNDAWHLQVEPKAFDMLLDSLPWSISTIKHPWMERVVYVEWRC